MGRATVAAGIVVTGVGIGACPAAASPAGASPPAPAGRIALYTESAQGKRVNATFVGTRLHVVALVSPFVAGQQVIVRIDRNGRLVLRRSLAVAPLGDGRGRVMVNYTSQLPGTLLVRATHSPTPQQGRLDAASRKAIVVPMHAGPGSHGYAVWALQHDLAGLGYSVYVSGRYDDATTRAVIAYQKITGLARDGIATSRIFRLLLHGHGLFHVRYRNHGRHFEADLTHQVLAEIDPGGHVRRIYEMSSGKPSTPTVVGSFRIYEKALGTNAKGMVDSNYFIRGYAIHGYADVPPYAASHGCLRIPIPDAASVFAWARIGEIVDVYDRNGGGSHRVRGNAGP
jgi:peptidoglycan hydrolase-like protein with peptidoglycan-binding domain